MRTGFQTSDITTGLGIIEMLCKSYVGELEFADIVSVWRDSKPISGLH